MFKFFSKINDRINKFFEEREKKKAICSECHFCKLELEGSFCLHPSRVEVNKDYVTGRMTKSYDYCSFHNGYGKCSKFKQKKENK